MGSIPAVCTPHWHLCCPRNYRRWCPKCHWHTTPLFQACYRRIQIAEFHQMCKTLEIEVNFVHYMFTCRDAVWWYTYLNTWSQHWKLVSRRLELVNIQSEMLHLRHSETEQGSMEVVVSHKRYSYMKLHLCKKATNLNHVYSYNERFYTENCYQWCSWISIPDVVYPSMRHTTLSFLKPELCQGYPEQMTNHALL